MYVADAWAGAEDDEGASHDVLYQDAFEAVRMHAMEKDIDLETGSMFVRNQFRASFCTLIYPIPEVVLSSSLQLGPASVVPEC